MMMYRISLPREWLRTNQMYRHLFLVFLLAVFTLQIFSQNNPRKIVGAYQWCSFPCSTIKLNEDFTFDYLLDGDLFNEERIKGNWKFVGKNKIYLKSVEKPSNFSVEEKQTEVRNKILIQTIDTGAAVLPGVKVKVNFEGKEAQFITDENGFCEIPNVNKIEIAYLKTVESYKFADSRTTELLIMVEPPTVFDIDGNYLIENGKLFRLNNENGAIENEFKKLKTKFVRELFPEK